MFLSIGNPCVCPLFYPSLPGPAFVLCADPGFPPMRPRLNGDRDSGGAVESPDLGVGWKDMVYVN